MTGLVTPPSAPAPGTAPAQPRGRPTYYAEHRGDLNQRLRVALDADRLKALHVRSGWRHALVAGRQFALLFGLAAVLILVRDPWIWVPVAALQGFAILGFIILLHDVIHGAVFPRRRPGLSRILALAYAAPSAISASQFERWHMDHHFGLGSEEEDPKRHHLSPKINSRWVKVLYMTPVLFAIYARAAAGEAKTYEPDLQRRIKLERLGNVLLHAAFVALLWQFFDGATVVRAWLVPVFGFFPAAFILNRIGQHYWIDPTDPAKWSTRVDGSLVTRLLFLNSNHHIEHHYYPSVPLYRLPELNRALRPFWDEVGHRNRTYPVLLWKWFVENREAHTDWSRLSEKRLRCGAPTGRQE